MVWFPNQPWSLHSGSSTKLRQYSHKEGLRGVGVGVHVEVPATQNAEHNIQQAACSM